MCNVIEWFDVGLLFGEFVVNGYNVVYLEFYLLSVYGWNESLY